MKHAKSFSTKTPTKAIFITNQNIPRTANNKKFLHTVSNLERQIVTKKVPPKRKIQIDISHIKLNTKQTHITKNQHLRAEPTNNQEPHRSVQKLFLQKVDLFLHGCLTEIITQKKGKEMLLENPFDA